MAGLEDKSNSSHQSCPTVSSENLNSSGSSNEDTTQRTCQNNCTTNVRSGNKARMKRYTIDLTARAAVELERIQGKFDLSAVDVFRNSLLLMRIYAETISENKELQIVDPKNPKIVKVIQLPMFL